MLVFIKASNNVGTPNKILGLYFSNNLSNFLALNCGTNITSQPKARGALIDTPKPNPWNIGIIAKTEYWHNC